MGKKVSDLKKKKKEQKLSEDMINWFGGKTSTNDFKSSWSGIFSNNSSKKEDKKSTWWD